MMELSTVLLASLTVFAVVLGARRWCSVRRARSPALSEGALVFVRTSDKKRLIARVLSRGPSHFWIELAPGDARWWVPASAIEPMPAFLARRIERDRAASGAGRPEVNVAGGEVTAVQRRTHIS